MRTQWIRIYSQHTDADLHSFHVAYMGGGVSQRVACFDIDERTSFTDLRHMVCWQEYNGSYRRTVPLYSELLEAMKCSTNQYSYSEEDQREFRFGVATEREDGTISVGKEKQNSCNNDLPRIIQSEVEDEPIDQIINLGLDLILVPLILIPK
jgi:hypothetical protein